MIPAGFKIVVISQNLSAVGLCRVLLSENKSVCNYESLIFERNDPIHRQMNADDSVGKYFEEISSEIPDASDRVQVINLIIRGRF